MPATSPERQIGASSPSQNVNTDVTDDEQTTIIADSNLLAETKDDDKLELPNGTVVDLPNNATDKPPADPGQSGQNNP